MSYKPPFPAQQVDVAFPWPQEGQIVSVLNPRIALGMQTRTGADPMHTWAPHTLLSCTAGQHQGQPRTLKTTAASTDSEINAQHFGAILPFSVQNSLS